ncbi:MAG: aspartate aminotransferase family protein [Proteobacteria bacterium]|nr:aspartate aminotransferase family protein [Pseudomonadota bacterium]MBI3498383.1 aspartate aminotransferase family protein [Pseudomonadota bacterium]
MISAVMPTYGRYDLAFERGEGPYLFATDGRRFLDFASGIAVNALGHSHPHLVKALSEQAKRVWHTSNLYRIPEQERLAERLVENSFADTVFFCNSGAEAVECSIKVARKYHDESGTPERYRVIGCAGSFHGRTLATLAAAGNEKYLKGFDPIVEGFDHVAFGNLNELRAAITPETAAILVEPVQGEGGIRPASLDYLRQLRAVADEFGLLLIFDEVQCGMGRSGKLFAHEWAGVTPDIMATAKGLGNGFPVGACLATERAAKGMTAGSHGSTFGGNPLAMAVANAVLDVVLADGFLGRVDKVARRLWRELEALVKRHPKVLAEARGAGLILGLKCHVTNTTLVDKARELGLLTVGAGENVVRLVPPLIIEDAHVQEAVATLDRACAQLAA